MMATDEHEGHSYSEVWRRFEEHPLTHSMAHYILAISELAEERGYVRATDVARKLGVTKGSASIALRTIRERGFVREDENRMLFLTKSGKAACSSVVNARVTFLRFFRDVLALDEETALENACKLEHLVTGLTSERLFRFVRFLSESPSGRMLLNDFRRLVVLCGPVEDCDKCESIDDCTERMFSVTSRSVDQAKPKQASPRHAKRKQ